MSSQGIYSCHKKFHKLLILIAGFNEVGLPGLVYSWPETIPLQYNFLRHSKLNNTSFFTKYSSIMRINFSTYRVFFVLAFVYGNTSRTNEQTNKQNKQKYMNMVHGDVLISRLTRASLCSLLIVTVLSYSKTIFLSISGTL